jgi:glycosyltransferase involved in cell wall biosynthesis
MQSVVFYFPSLRVGGVQTLFIRLANAISKTRKVYYIDYEGGYATSKLNKEVTVLIYSEEKLLKIPRHSVLILQSNHLIKPVKNIELNSDVKLFFWQLHPVSPYVLFPYFSTINLDSQIVHTIFYKHFVATNTLIRKAMEKSAYYFMDQSNIDSSKKVYDGKEFEILPLFMGTQSPIKWINRDNKAQLKIIWFGRLELGFKSNILERLIEDANNYNAKIVLTIIGDGDAQPELEELCRSKKNLKVEFLGSLLGAELENTLLDCNIVFAMGTCAVQAASYGVPTVCLDFSYSKISNNYRYRWLHETSGHSLGYLMVGDNFPKENQYTFEQLITAVQSNPVLISEKSSAYIADNYMKDVEHYIQTFESSKLKPDELDVIYKNHKIAFLMHRLGAIKTNIISRFK